MSSHIRIGRAGSIVDNMAKGGIVCEVKSDGKLGNFACSLHPFTHVVNTDTGLKLAGYQIERFDVILSTVLKAHSAIPFFGIIGWDVCVADDGRIVIIEFNPDPDLRMEQLPYRDTCLKDYQDEILEEVYGLGHNSK